MWKLMIFAVLCGSGAVAYAGPSDKEQSPGNLSATDVVQKLEQRNSERLDHEPSIVCERLYTLDYKGFPGAKHAEMTVRATTTRGGKTFVILNESGSEALRNHVLHKLLEGEREAASAEMQAQTRISAENYQFQMEDVQGAPQHPIYLFQVVPRHKNKFAWRGQIWIDGIDFAVVRAQGTPEKMPSWWTTSTTYLYTNQKLQDQWIPAKNSSLTQVRLGGHADLEITYNHCHEEGSAGDPHAPPTSE